MYSLVKRNSKVEAMAIPANDRLAEMQEIEVHTWEVSLNYTDMVLASEAVNRTGSRPSCDGKN
ncbi:hypothetical protein [Ferrovibrio sp.]|uniref:hypothetical protein n=1 Tax=Ferrovibrio sp. TaxID=1917215 RepID=UPI003D153524